MYKKKINVKTGEERKIKLTSKEKKDRSKSENKLKIETEIIELRDTKSNLQDLRLALDAFILKGDAGPYKALVDKDVDIDSKVKSLINKLKNV